MGSPPEPGWSKHSLFRLNPPPWSRGDTYVQPGQSCQYKVVFESSAESIFVYGPPAVSPDKPSAQLRRIISEVGEVVCACFT